MEAKTRTNSSLVGNVIVPEIKATTIKNKKATIAILIFLANQIGSDNSFKNSYLIPLSKLMYKIFYSVSDH